MRISILILLLLSASMALAGIVGKEVTYQSDSLTMKGYIAYDSSIKGKQPGVLVVHEWWGHNAYARKRAEMLASLGYVALAVDMYGNGKVADHPDDAGKFASEVSKSMSVMKARFDAALATLKQNEHVDPARIAAIGYCFGGGVVLNMAREGEDLKAVASFHGALSTDTPAEAGKVKTKILVCTGGADKFITPGVVEGFKNEMKAAGADFRVIVYPGATHSFTNPDADELAKKFNMPIAYDKKADQESWDEMKKFFKKTLGK